MLLLGEKKWGGRERSLGGRFLGFQSRKPRRSHWHSFQAEEPHGLKILAYKIICHLREYTGSIRCQKPRVSRKTGIQRLCVEYAKKGGNFWLTWWPGWPPSYVLKTFWKQDYPICYSKSPYTRGCFLVQCCSNHWRELHVYLKESTHVIVTERVQSFPGKTKRKQEELGKGGFGLSILCVFKSKSSNSDFVL